MVVLNRRLRIDQLPVTPLLKGERMRVCDGCGVPRVESPFKTRSAFRRRGRRLDDECHECWQWDCFEMWEAAGGVLPDAARSRGGLRGRCKRCPSAPFRAWLEDRIDELVAPGSDGIERVRNAASALVAARIGVDQRTMWRWRHELGELIEEDVVERAAIGDGRWSVEEIYERYGSGADATPVREPMRDSCCSPGCDAPRNGGRFCREHMVQLRRWAEELKVDARRWRDARGSERATCCRPGCLNERRHGADYCDACQDKGWGDDG